MDFKEEIYKKILGESLTIILLIAVSYYFVTREREQHDRLIDLYERDRKTLIEAIKEYRHGK
jgi:hypothetical protein